MGMKKVRTLYTWLGIGEEASPDEIKRAWKAMAKLHHPDRGGEAVRFGKIQKAYSTLSDPVKRRKYDKKVRMVRIRLRMENVRDQVFERFQTVWDAETAQYETRRRKEDDELRKRNSNSPNAAYFSEQEKAEREWKNEYDAMMRDYYKADSHTVGMESILHTTDELLYSILSDGIIRMGTHRMRRDPVDVKIEPEVRVAGRTRDAVTELRDTIVRAERLVKIFNKFTGGV